MLAPVTGVLLMDAYFNFLTQVVQYWMNGINTVMRLGMSSPTVALMARPRVLVRSAVPSDQQADGAIELWDVGQAAPLIDMRGVRISAPKIHVVIDPALYASRTQRHC
jgi:hypothetical protein